MDDVKALFEQLAETASAELAYYTFLDWISPEDMKDAIAEYKRVPAATLKLANGALDIAGIFEEGDIKTEEFEMLAKAMADAALKLKFMRLTQK